MTKVFCFEKYSSFLKKFIAQGYDCIPFAEYNSDKQRQLILRHDIDYDTGLAFQCAKEEYNLGIKSSYFFLLRSDFYNVLSPSNYDNILKIKALGHQISLHYDPSIYNSEKGNLLYEISIFENLFDIKVDIISLHRPSNFYLNFDQPIELVEHTYQSKYFRKIKYCSDSTGIWRFGSPFETDEFKKGENIQLLIHPIWWFQSGATNHDVIKRQIDFQRNKLNDLWLSNSIPYQNMYDEK